MNKFYAMLEKKTQKIKYPTVEYVMSEYMDFGYSYLKWANPRENWILFTFAVFFFYMLFI